MTISFYVLGTPAPQGSKRHVGNGVMVESSKAVAPWRDSVAYATQKAMADSGSERLTGAVGLILTFYLARPKVAKKLVYSSKRPDVDKLQRSTLDGLTTGGLWNDDAQVASLRVDKLYVVGNEVPGCRVEAWPL